ncbi:MAG: hypothetical protein IKW97_04490 [Muribaculaceae bacterium]|nr:hypothetical protein [Muribaculaceae bacterium]
MRIFAVDSKKIPISTPFGGFVLAFGYQAGRQEAKVLKKYCLLALPNNKNALPLQQIKLMVFPIIFNSKLW